MTYTGAGIAYQCGMLEDKLDEHMVRIEALLVGWAAIAHWQFSSTGDSWHLIVDCAT